MRRWSHLVILASLVFGFCSGLLVPTTEAAGSSAVLPMSIAWQTRTPIPKTAKAPEPTDAKKTSPALATQLQGMGPTTIAVTKDGTYAYVGFHLSDTIFKIHLTDLSVEAVADLSQYFPIQCYSIILDAGEQKLFVHSASWQKLIDLDTQTLSVIHTIDNINSVGIFRSQYGGLVVWNGGNTVKLVNTETYAVSELTDPSLAFLQIQESPSDQNKWYVATQLGPGAPWTIGSYDHVAKAWIHTVTIPLQGDTPGIMDFKVLPNESKAYVGVVGGWYPDNHSYGWVYSIDLATWQVKSISVDGGGKSLETSPDSRRLYVAADHPKPEDTNNILVIDAQSDTVLGSIQLGRNKYNWAYTEIHDLQIDLANPDLLYAVSNDANALVRIDLNSLAPDSVIVFNKENLHPHIFAKRPSQPNGYILIQQSAKTFGFDIDQAAVTEATQFPMIRPDAYTYDVAMDNSGKMLIAQGEYFLELDSATMHLLGTHPLPAGTPSIWNFVLSRNQSRLYAVAGDQSNIFLAINRADFQVAAQQQLQGGVFEFRPFELPDGSKLYALGGYQNGAVTIQVIRTDNFTIQKTLTFQDPNLLEGISAGPYFPYAYDPSSHTLFVGAADVALAIDTDNDVIKKVIYLREVATAIGLEPQQLVYVNAIGLVYQPHENYLYMAHLDRSFVSIYDLNNDRFLPQVIPLKGFFPWFAFTNDAGSMIYVVDTRSDSISVVDVATKTVEKVIDLHDYLNELYLPLLLRSTH